MYIYTHIYTQVKTVVYLCPRCALVAPVRTGSPENFKESNTGMKGGFGGKKSLHIACVECLYFTYFALRCRKGTEELPGQNYISFPAGIWQHVVNLGVIEWRAKLRAGSI